MSEYNGMDKDLIRQQLTGNIEVCDKCGKNNMKYLGIGEYKCEDCGNIMYDEYGKVRQFLEHNPGANVVETSMATGVSKSRIKQLLYDDKIQIAPGSSVFLTCRKCGTQIASGQYCERCTKELNAFEKASHRTSNITGGFGKAQSGAAGARRFDHP